MMAARITNDATAPDDLWRQTVLQRLDMLEEQVRAARDWIAATQAAADDFVKQCTTGQAD